MKKLIVAVAALALMAGSAYAAEWNFYGEAKIWTGWYDKDVTSGAEPNTDEYDTQYSEGLLASSKIGANVVVSDELTARFEYGTNGGNANIRHLYGVWNFGSGSLLVGQSDTPLNVAYSNQLVPVENGDGINDLGLAGYGDLDNDRHPELMLTFGGFSIAFLAPETDADDTIGLGYETQAIMPMIAMCYKASFDMGEAQIAAGYNRFEIDDDEDIDAYVVGLGTQLNFGAVGMFATFVWGENMGNFDANNGTQYGGLATYNSVTGDIDDCETLGGTVGLTFAINEMLSLEAGYGYIHDELDDASTTSIAQSYYMQAGITLAPGVVVTPEVGMIDNREAGEEETLYFGATWAISF